MKNFLYSGVAAVALLSAVPAMAADLSQPYPVKAPVVAPLPVFSWTGFYLGANAGYAWGSGNKGLNELDVDPSGWLAGGQVGFNYQFGNNVVLGAEADLQGSDINDSNGFYGVSSKLDYFGTVRARLGYAFDNVMPYVTGGFAYGHNKIDYLGWDESKTHTGWTAGAGVEYAFNNNWTAKIEYLYVDLGDEYYSNIDAKAGINSNIVRAGINYKF
ncbi:porin family protein [Ancylobacter sp. 6x-1]|uniref:Porin family protein n=1 Tax=Ancylobacter crimeensis TaxID=2579147 RepID=A0ABT0DA79_9HYPH|nr:outer membrane protein [Ancylobacter crimeensis]MCK0196697.1 porin family protein [Ancylobacter crimeensis]